MVFILLSVDFLIPIASMMSSGMIDQANFENLSFASIKIALLILSLNESHKNVAMFLRALHSVHISFSKSKKLVLLSAHSAKIYCS